MSQFDAIVIGGGVNGLIAGTLLGRRGKNVCIIEKSTRFGGMASYSVDGGPTLAHSLYNLSPRALSDIGIDPQHPVLSGKPVSTVSLSEDGRHIVFKNDGVYWSDGTKHPESSAWSDLTQRLITYGSLLRQLAEAPAPGGQKTVLSRGGLNEFLRLAKLGIGLKKLGKSEMRRFLQVVLSNVHDIILDDLPEGPVAGLLAADAIWGSATGPRSPGTVFNLIYRLGHGGIITQPAGGMSALTDLMVEAAQKAGCVLMPKTEASRILLDNDTVSGVETTDGRTITAPIVLSNLAPKITSQMTGPSVFDIETIRRVRNIRACGTAAKVNLRLKDNSPLPGLPEQLANERLIFAPSVEYVEAAFNPAKYRQMSKAPVIEAFKVQTADGASWLSTIVQYAPSDLEGGWTESAKEKLAQTTVETLSRSLPGLGDHISGKQVITQDQIESATGAPGGHWHHAEMALDQLLTLRPANGMARYSMGPKGLFQCGAATHPGGDVMGLAGRNAALAALEAQP
ncbi:ribulose-1,5-biphosphate synthetase [Ruegeria sp. THAF57]|uniref:phytoene desaturase family protein n=1 Tax=Ruegeria sp. THAF57 TaxID=2744555 RepID=UPI0015DE7E09|nr:NAD(P)/FAD-dependent oxidoreductase [Ruegeria sp. THAF57]CAD0185136.1 ribulose-1,5-biphosphate synthetase [Ruegeria sp. THAF57]